jgi:hypothetical protein
VHTTNNSPLKHQCFVKIDWCNRKVIIIVESIVTWNTYMKDKIMISAPQSTQQSHCARTPGGGKSKAGSGGAGKSCPSAKDVGAAH